MISEWSRQIIHSHLNPSSCPLGAKCEKKKNEPGSWSPWCFCESWYCHSILATFSTKNLATKSGRFQTMSKNWRQPKSIFGISDSWKVLVIFLGGEGWQGSHTVSGVSAAWSCQGQEVLTGLGCLSAKELHLKGGSRCKVAVCRILKFTLSQIVTGVISPYLEKMFVLRKRCDFNLLRRLCI